LDQQGLKALRVPKVTQVLKVLWVIQALKDQQVLKVM
jgi:hypothetical protein